jgi:hypothetical protein
LKKLRKAEQAQFINNI